MRTMVVVPCYNEGKSIFNLVICIKRYNPDVDIVVVDDGSSDNTIYEARSAGALVIPLCQNLGIGGAVQTGYIYALNKDYDIVVQIDGDGQHNPSELEKLIHLLENKEADMAIGSRFVSDTGYIPSIARKLGIIFFSVIVSSLCNKKFHDTTSGYRAVSRKGIELFAKYYPRDYPEVETIVYAWKNGLKVEEVSVSMEQRKYGKSTITPIKSIYYLFKVTFATFRHGLYRF
ncbi:MAG: glycosyltransferase family 2 protein [Bacillota bacterium]|nr:glycosyltransferase family 2 protein [Bacillota bacterium]